MSSWDVIVLGANPDGLAAAGSLARRGKRVLVLERSEHTGGLAAGRQLAPGCRTRGILQDTSHVSPKLIRRLGLKTIDPPPVLGLQSEGPGLLLHRGAAVATEEIADVETILQEDDDVEEIELEEEDDEPLTETAVRKRASRDAATSDEQETEPGWVKGFLVVTSLVMILGVPVVMAVAKDQISSLARAIAEPLDFDDAMPEISDR